MPESSNHKVHVPISLRQFLPKKSNSSVINLDKNHCQLGLGSPHTESMCSRHLYGSQV